MERLTPLSRAGAVTSGVLSMGELRGGWPRPSNANSIPDPQRTRRCGSPNPLPKEAWLPNPCPDEAWFPNPRPLGGVAPQSLPR